MAAGTTHFTERIRAILTDCAFSNQVSGLEDAASSESVQSEISGSHFAVWILEPVNL
jgi:hypothetical protein